MKAVANAKTVTLIHRERVMVTYTLDHATYCAALGTCQCTDTELRAGDRFRARKEPSVLTLMPREKKTGVPEAVTKAVAVMQAIKDHRIVVRTEH